ncbi:MAG: SDR family oxidoreductase [Emcibacter sp.]|nr:SDR family oxidoreductase [Emcibacter sp.]MBL4894356.1 SDR family oxidoreductase [Emcibacter sp.]
MDLNIKGRTALITGGSKGLGFASAEAMAREGVKLALAARTEETLRKAAESIGAIPIVSDLSDRAGVLACIDKTRDVIGDPDILVINTGGPQPATFAESTPDGWRTATDQLFHFTIEMITAFLEPMKQKGWGRIVVITSFAAKEPVPNLLYSNALRAGIHGLVNSIASEVAADGVTINAVMPGFIKTDRMTSMGLDLDRVAKTIPAKRLGQPSELGDLVAFLCSERATYINGQAIACDGGLLQGI